MSKDVFLHFNKLKEFFNLKKKKKKTKRKTTRLKTKHN